MSSGNKLSRLNFLRAGSLTSLAILIETDPLAKLLAKNICPDVHNVDKYAFSCELFRPDDMLYLRYYFFNAKRDKKTIRNYSDQYPILLYIQLPGQHISEELLDNPHLYRVRGDFKKSQASFSAGSSMLAFRTLPDKKGKYKTKLRFEVDELLNWKEHFALITIDDFADLAQSGDGETYRTRYDEALTSIKKQISGIPDENTLIRKPKSLLQEAPCMPLTFFEVPYKMYLSPIAEPYEINGKSYSRNGGVHFFSNGNNGLNEEFSDPRNGLKIIKPWENSLLFKAIDGSTLMPRFKVVHYQCQSSSDRDDNVDLLPAAIHRYDLHELTMREEYDRDIWSDFFHFSVLGAKTNLYYKNDDPTIKHALVAWKQKIMYGRDNLVSVTYRAVDYFTGLKLQVSILSDRGYKAGISFMPKLYYVEFAEEYKEYDDPAVISRMHCRKITPLVKGAYFYPQDDIGADRGAYAVDHPEGSGKPFDCDRLLDFEYLCIDKAGNEFNMKMKMIFIPAEIYQITLGKYVYRKGEEIIKEYGPGQPDGAKVDIKYIGQLYPPYYVGYKGAANCGTPPEDEYKFDLVKTFDDKKELKGILDAVKKHVEDNKICYSSKEETEITYADISGLKGVVDTNGNALDDQQGQINKDSASATFPTQSLLMGADVNEGLYNSSSEDIYRERFPIAPGLMEANVIIKQIDQLEGVSNYRNVTLAEVYKNSGAEISADKPENTAKLLFKLTTELKNFFSANYKASGAVVNPGIEITHVSVLDEGITYGEIHNQIAEKHKAARKVSGNDIMKMSDVPLPAASIFKPLKAEILGIPLTDILHEVLPVKDIPGFEFIQEAQEVATKLDALVTGLSNDVKAEIEKRRSEYTRLKNTIETLPDQIRAAERQLKQYEQQLTNELKLKVKSWFESILDQYGVADYYTISRKLHAQYKTLVDDYQKHTLNLVKSKVQAIHVEIESILNDPSLANIIKFYDKIKADQAVLSKYSLAIFKEAVKAYAIEKITTSKGYNDVINALVKLEESVRAAEAVAKEKYLQYYNAVFNGIKEASFFISTVAIDEFNKAQKQVSELRNDIITEYQKYYSEIDSYPLDLYRLSRQYEQYLDIYNKLRKEDYKIVLKELKYSEEVITNMESSVKKIEEKLSKDLADSINRIELPNFPGGLSATRETILGYKGRLVKAINDANGAALRNYNEIKENLVIHYPAFSVTTLLEEAVAKVVEINDELIRLQNEVEGYKKLLKEEESKFRDFGKGLVAYFEQEFERAKRQLIDEVEGSAAYNNVLKLIEQYRAVIAKLRQVANQRLEYKFSTANFKPANFAGVIDFAPNSGGKTSLDINVQYNIEFDISEQDAKPVIKKQSYLTDSQFTNFKLGILKLIYVEFSRVRFITGSDVKDDFQVSIRNVQFGGALNFVDAFKDYLKSIDKNLVFDINASGASIGYGITIPDFTAGYFNFFNMSLSALFTLPFDPRKSLQLQFGFGNELNKFGLTVSGIFGGQGYFNIIAEPRRGIVGMVLVLEFGAIFNINLGVAWGSAYLVGGIYIKRYYGNFEIRGYILCVGRLNILGIFSASLTFYLGLEQRGNGLWGVCVVTASKRFTRWFSISVSCKFEKTIKRAASRNTTNDQVRYKSNIAPADFEILYSNLHKGYIAKDEKIHVHYSAPNNNIEVALRPVNGSWDKINATSQRGTTNNDMYGWEEVDYSITNNPRFQNLGSGEYELRFKYEGKDVYRQKFWFVKDDTLAEKCDIPQHDAGVGDREYYGAYYY